MPLFLSFSHFLRRTNGVLSTLLSRKVYHHGPRAGLSSPTVKRVIFPGWTILPAMSNSETGGWPEAPPYWIIGTFEQKREKREQKRTRNTSRDPSRRNPTPR